MKERKQRDNKVKPETVDWEDKYKRALADYHNLLKQTAKEKSEAVKYGNQALLIELLPVYGHLRTVAESAVTQDPWIEGVKYVVKQFKEVLTGAGVEEVETCDKPFNHQVMDAVGEEPAESVEQDGLVAKEVGRGYLLNGRVVMPAKVTVYKFKNN